MEPGDKCICQADEWYNAYGEERTMLGIGMRLTVKETRMISGLRFYAFEEAPAGNYFMCEAFKALRSMN